MLTSFIHVSPVSTWQWFPGPNQAVVTLGANVSGAPICWIWFACISRAVVTSVTVRRHAIFTWCLAILSWVTWYTILDFFLTKIWVICAFWTVNGDGRSLWTVTAIGTVSTEWFTNRGTFCWPPRTPVAFGAPEGWVSLNTRRWAIISRWARSTLAGIHKSSFVVEGSWKEKHSFFNFLVTKFVQLVCYPSSY